MDEDENISMIFGMGFSDLNEIKRCLRLAKNDVNEAVSYLMDQPAPFSMDTGDMDFKSDQEIFASEDNSEFPAAAVFELENRVFQDNWSIPYKREELLGVCLEASTRLAKDNLLEQNDAARKFLDRILPEAFRKLVSSNATHRWLTEVQEGIMTMCELYIDLLTTRLAFDPVPTHLLQTLGLILDYKTDWSSKNREQSPKNSFDISGDGDGRITYAEPSQEFPPREQYGWVVDLINLFGEKNGFKLIQEKLDIEENHNAKTMSSLLLPLANCAPLLLLNPLKKYLSPCMDAAFKFAKGIKEDDLKSKDMNHLYDLCYSLKVLCHHLWPNHASECDRIRLEIIGRMLKTPHYNCRMNGLKEVSRLIEESERKKNKHAISGETVMEWMAENRILSVVLEGNIDQVQYTDKIKGIVEFLGPNLSHEELRNIWNLGEGENSHVMENVHGVLASASSRFSLSQLELINKLIKEKWSGSNSRIKEKLIRLIGQIGKETVGTRSMKPTHSALALLWEVAHFPDLPRHLVERAFNEHLATLAEININVDAIRRQYVMACVDDIKKGGATAAIPSVKHLHDILRTYASKAASIYQKASKQTLSELNKQHEIVKLISTSLNKAHKQGVSAAQAQGLTLKPDTLVDSLYTHQESVDTHLQLMMFLLKDGDLYLSWSRCKEVWETLVDNENSIQMDQDCIFLWFTSCISDLEPETQRQFFKEKLLSLQPATVSQNSFSCLRKYFESVNCHEGKLKKNTVERVELTGIEYFWDIITDCTRDDIAMRAIELVLEMSYLNVSPRLKKDPRQLHTTFINTCFDRLEEVEGIVQQGFELETACAPEPDSSSPRSLPPSVSNATKGLPAISVSKVSISSLGKGPKVQRTRRLLLLAEKYILAIEVLFNGKRTILPHAATFYGRPLIISVRVDPQKEEFDIESHTNESVGSVKAKIAEKLQIPVSGLAAVSIDAGEDETLLESGRGKDARLVSLVGDAQAQNWKVKTTSSSSTSTAVVTYGTNSSSATYGSNSSAIGGATASSTAAAAGHSPDTPNQDDGISLSRQAYDLEEEKSLPGVLMANNADIFNKLYKLANMEDGLVLAGIRRLIHLIPTDSEVVDALDGVGQFNHLSGADASPKMSPRMKRSLLTGSNSSDMLQRILDASAANMTPFRVLYNLEVLSGRIMPSWSSVPRASAKFGEEFVRSGGLRHILNVLDKEALPFDVDYDIRQSAYLIALQLAGYLLCGQTVLHHADVTATAVAAVPNPSSSPLVRPTPPKKTALDLTETRSPLALSASKIVQTMPETEFVELLSCLVSVVWAAAAGKLFLASMGVQAAPKPERVYIGRRSRDSSTGSSGSLGSEGSSVELTLHAGVCAQQTQVSPADCQIAGEALELLVTCLSLRQNLLPKFYKLPSVNDFIIDTVLGSPAQSVRQRAVQQFIRLSKIKLVRRNLSLSDNFEEKKSIDPRDPKHFLTLLLMKTPVPLWIPSCKSRTTSHQIMSNCGEYLDLRCQLFRNLSSADQERLQENAKEMIDDEISWLLNFSPCNSVSDSEQLAGHIKLIESLLSCEGVSKDEVGLTLIEPLISLKLFPASILISEGGLSNNCMTKPEITPLLDTEVARGAAYSLLTELATGSNNNMQIITKRMLELHHRFDPNLAKEHLFEYEPAIERRADCNFVGLKNGGATCYINSVLQQLYAVPTISDQLLSVNIDVVDEESVFFQLQAVFAHLQESKLKHYVPERFWKCFRLWGQPVNVREQQDACEFFIQIVDQVDEYLGSQNKDKIFSKLFEGVFSDQKICEGCPHRYEREEKFMSLNLEVKSGNLQESLSHYVQGELLEGDNAYFCEKCAQKRNTIKRMCIRKLPSTLVIQLKRFHYDWETNRSMKFDDYFSFPRVLDMGPYTTEGIAAKEDRDSLQAKLSPGLSLDHSLKPVAIDYDLVGVVVHSGQANAGHYYSFIKDRKGHSVVNPQKNKWFKYNDTTVEQINMTDETLEAECFGGKFRAKKKEGSNLPEERQRYWNGYILVYEARQDHKTPRTPKKSFCGSSSRRSVGPSMVRRITLPSRTSEPGKDSLVRESLSELSDLLEKGEKQGIFSSKIPALIERGIREDNMRFMQNRDLHSELYFKWMLNLATVNLQDFHREDNSDKKDFHRDRRVISTNSSDARGDLYQTSLTLAINFFLNTYCHVRRRKRHVMNDWIDVVDHIISTDKGACDWLLNLLAADDFKYLKPYLLECPARDVRTHFSNLLEKTFSASFRLTKKSLRPSGRVVDILVHLVSLLDKEVSDAIKFSSQYFWVLSMYAQMGPDAVSDLFGLGLFSAAIKFLLGLDLKDEVEEPVKKGKQWTGSQVREFNHLHCLLAFMILVCNMTPYTTTEPTPPKPSSNEPTPQSNEPSSTTMPNQSNTDTDMVVIEPSQSETESSSRSRTVRDRSGTEKYYGQLEMPKEVSQLLYGPLASLYIADAVLLFRENSNSLVVDMLTGASYCCKDVSLLVLGEVLRQYSTVSSSELRHLSHVLVEILCISDPIQSERLQLAVYSAKGLLDLVQTCQKTDTSRAYQSIKCLVSASSKNQAVKDYLFLQPARWQWAVNWLKSKMEGTYWSDSVLSNEDSNNRTFHRTTSAQVTLEEANAMLAEFDNDIVMETDQPDMNVDLDPVET